MLVNCGRRVAVKQDKQISEIW